MLKPEEEMLEVEEILYAGVIDLDLGSDST